MGTIPQESIHVGGFRRLCHATYVNSSGWMNAKYLKLPLQYKCTTYTIGKYKTAHGRNKSTRKHPADIFPKTKKHPADGRRSMDANSTYRCSQSIHLSAIMPRKKGKQVNFKKKKGKQEGHGNRFWLEKEQRIAPASCSWRSSYAYRFSSCWNPPSSKKNSSILINQREKSSLHPWTITKVRFSTLNYKTG